MQDGGGLCALCLSDAQLGQVCLHCHKPLAHAPPHRCGSCLKRQRWRPTISGLNYHHPAGRFVGLGKQRRQPSLYTAALAPLVTKLNQLQQQGLLITPDALVAVPIHRTRLRQLGFNHAHIIAKQLGDALGIEVIENLVGKRHCTANQQQLDAKARRRNLKQAFSVTQTGKGQNLALIDDVITTGSTLSELSGELTRNGFRVSQSWTLASALYRTPNQSN